VSTNPTFHGGPIGTHLPAGKPRRYVLYDRETIWGPNTRTLFFVDCMKTAFGTKKDKSFTNMAQNGSLGYPLEFDVAYISVYPIAGSDEYLETYDRFAKSQAVFTFVTGSNTVYDARPMALMNVKSIEDRWYRDRITNEQCYVTIEDGKVVVNKLKPIKEFPLEGLFADRGSPRFMNAMTPERQARHIVSTESFHAEIINPNPDPNQKGFDVYVCLEGMLYCP